MKTTTLTPALERIAANCAAHAELGESIKRILDTVESQIRAVIDQNLPAVRELARAYAVSEAEIIEQLHAAVGDFQKPRTRIFSGIKVGFQTGKGSVVFDEGNEQAVIDRILELKPEQMSALIRTEMSVNKDAVKRLAPETLARIGCTIDKPENEVVFSSVDGEIEKLFKTLHTKLVSSMAKPDRAA